MRVILVGNTNIKNGITTTTFAALPDVPVTSITVNLPTGSHSALTANGNVCASTLKMPTTIVAQNGITFKQNTTIRVNNCPVRIVGHKTVGNTAYLTVQTYSPGRISGSGANLATRYRNLKQAQKTPRCRCRSRVRARARAARCGSSSGRVRPQEEGRADLGRIQTVTFG